MPIFYKCDRCHSESRDSMIYVRIPRYTGYTKLAEDDTIDKMLCDNCIRDINDWVKPQAVAAH